MNLSKNIVYNKRIKLIHSILNVVTTANQINTMTQRVNGFIEATKEHKCGFIPCVMIIIACVDGMNKQQITN